MVNYSSVQKDAMLSFWLIFPKTFILMGQSKTTNELSLIIYRMFSSKWIASLSVLITLKKIKSITKHREKNQIVLLTWKSFSLRKISLFFILSDYGAIIYNGIDNFNTNPWVILTRNKILC